MRLLLFPKENTEILDLLVYKKILLGLIRSANTLDMANYCAQNVGVVSAGDV